MRFTNIAIALAVSAAAVTTANAARDTIQIAGSSTVLPYASIVAEEFGNTFPQFKTPVVGSGGSSGGLKQFCNGVGDNVATVSCDGRSIFVALRLVDCAFDQVNLWCAAF